MLFKPYSQLFSNSATLFARLFFPKHKGRRQRMSAGIRPALRPYLRVASKGRSFPALVYCINAIIKSARLAASPTRRTPDCPRILQTSTRSNPRSRWPGRRICTSSNDNINRFLHLLLHLSDLLHLLFLTFLHLLSIPPLLVSFVSSFISLLASSIFSFPPHVLTSSFFSSSFLSPPSPLSSHFTVTFTKHVRWPSGVSASGSY